MSVRLATRAAAREIDRAYQIAKNCRTSVEMIEKYYASHLKNTLDAAAINVRRPKTKKKNEPPTEQEMLK
jgi:hypothetical protein